jgi:hypothetical protein
MLVNNIPIYLVHSRQTQCDKVELNGKKSAVELSQDNAVKYNKR